MTPEPQLDDDYARDVDEDPWTPLPHSREKLAASCHRLAKTYAAKAKMHGERQVEYEAKAAEFERLARGYANE